jgi:hypothetical protein
VSEKNKVSPLKGKFFHSMKSDDKAIHWQGQIVDELTPGYFLLQLFSWLDGRPTDQMTVALADMRGWKFYTSQEAMVEAGNRLREGQFHSGDG